MTRHPPASTSAARKRSWSGRGCSSRETVMAALLGIDIGTSGTKTLLISEEGRILASATHEYPLSTPRPGWAEQEPEHWWQATCMTVREVLSRAGLRGADVG